MRTIFIGDVHGMLDELNILIDRLALNVDDKVIFVGDLLDKGPDSSGVVKLVRALTDSNNVVVVMGNHEDTHFRYRGHLRKDIKIAKDMASRKSELPIITAALSTEDIAFLDKALPFYRVVEHNILVVHGGIPKSMKAFPSTVAELLSQSARDRKAFKLVLRTRHVDAHTGNFVGLGEEKPNDPFWADVYDGRFGHVIFGHQPFLDGIKYFPQATGIDTGAVFGGTLTALVYHENGSTETISIPSRAIADVHDYMKE